MLRFIISLKPLLIATLVAGALFFGPHKNTPAQTKTSGQTQQNPDSNILTDRIQQDGSLNQNQNQSGANNQGAIPQSVLAQIFGSEAIDQNFHLPDIGEISGNGSNSTTDQPDQNTAPTTEPARSIYNYLVASSNLGFSSDSSRLSIALGTAEHGDLTAINSLINDFQVRLNNFQTLNPPQELADIHGQSVQIIQNFIDLLKKARDAGTGSVQKTWQSPDRQTITDQATNLTRQIKDIVNRYGIVLPQDVLP